MSDPYNTADTHAGSSLPPPLPRRRNDRTGKRRGSSGDSSGFGARYSALIPVWNVLALIIAVVLAGGGRRSSLVTAVFLFSPLALAVVSNLWVENRGFAVFVRVLNALFAAYMLFKLLRFLRMDIYTLKMLVMFVISVCVPVLNAIWLKPRLTE